MNFAQPIWILIGILLCIGLLLLKKVGERRRQTALRAFAAPHLLPQLTRNISMPRRRAKYFLVVLSILFCFIALARPQYGSSWIEVKHRGIDILFALDTSKSMLAEDIKPNRLERARFAILDFVNQLNGDRVGLLPFAGSTFLSCPLTLDYAAFEQTLSAIDTDIIPRPGTNLAVVIAEAEQILTTSGNHKILILLTDGENLQGDALLAAREAAAKGMIIHTVAVGTREGELIPAGDGSYLKDPAGKFVTSRLDEKTLEEIAKVSGGLSVPLGDKGQGLESVYRQKLTLIEKNELGERRQKVPIERYSWPLSLAILLLSIDFLITERKQRNKRLWPFFSNLRQRFKKTRPVVLPLLAFLLLSTIAQKSTFASQAEESFARGEYLEAADLYRKLLEKKPNDPRLNYNYGSAVYKNNLFDEAIDSLNKALQTDDLEIQARAYYNKANAHYKKGAESKEVNRQRTIEEWQNALDAYSAALRLQPNDANARFNHDLVAKKLADLKKQQQEEKQQNQKKNGENPRDGSNSEQGQPEKENKSGQKSQQASQPPEPEQKGQENSTTTDHSKQPQANNGNEQVKEEEEAGENHTAQQQKMDSRQDSERRLQGKMTRDEAEKLLRSVKGEEKILNFTPAASQNDDQPERNW